MATATILRPGVYFCDQPPLKADLLPRMDIAVFVGFAQTGPADMPVAVEQMAQFTDIFGGSPPLYRRPSGDGRQRGHLEGAVRNFFENGGKRCWIVRVAGETKRLAHFDAGLFLDAELADEPVATLMDSAERIRYLSARPRQLAGIHALLGWLDPDSDEQPTLLAVPDACHEPWLQASAPDPAGIWLTLDPAPEPPATFACCARPAPIAGLTGTRETGRAVLCWQGSSGADTSYQVEQSSTPDFKLVDRSDVVREARFACSPTGSGDTYFRVCRVEGERSGPWSPVMRLAFPALPSAPDDGRSAAIDLEPLAAIHEAMLRLCAARGDLFALMALPSSLSRQQALNHARRLSAYGDTDAAMGSYGALFHPWIQSPNADGMITPCPPEGAVAGTMAARTADRGAWLAAANVPLKSAVALHPARPSPDPEEFLAAGINCLESLTDSIALSSEQTLSGDPDLQPIHVRRLLTVLRRVATRLGNRFVFEPNDLTLRSLVQRRFETLLESLFARGAFAGGTGSEAFQVSVADADAAYGEIEAGRLIVELRVRPAAALEFLLVRLVVSGGGATLLQAA